jgi:hypothetical protein
MVFLRDRLKPAVTRLDADLMIYQDQDIKAETLMLPVIARPAGENGRGDPRGEMEPMEGIESLTAAWTSDGW